MAEAISGAKTMREPWHLDKRVPLALIVTIALQTGTAVWWLSAQSHQVAQHDKDIATTQAVQGRHAEAIARLELRSQSLEQASATIIEQNRQLAGDVREMSRSIVRLETLMRAGGGRDGNSLDRRDMPAAPVPPPYRP